MTATVKPAVVAVAPAAAASASMPVPATKPAVPASASAGVPAPARPAVVAVAPAAAASSSTPAPATKPAVPASSPGRGPRPRPAGRRHGGAHHRSKRVHARSRRQALLRDRVASRCGTRAVNSSSEVEQAVHAWARAWADKNMTQYLAAYGTDFQTPGHVPRNAWEEDRRLRITGKSRITINLLELRVTVDWQPRRGKIPPGLQGGYAGRDEPQDARTGQDGGSVADRQRVFGQLTTGPHYPAPGHCFPARNVPT